MNDYNDGWPTCPHCGAEYGGVIDDAIIYRCGMFIREDESMQESVACLRRQLADMTAERDGLRNALNYMADERNWLPGWLLRRPGGGRRYGMVIISNDIYPWVYAREAAQAAKEK